jgi:hypothetical protein
LDEHLDSDELAWLPKIDAIIADDKVRTIWKKVRTEIAAALALAARLVVPHDVVEWWLTRHEQPTRDAPSDQAQATPEFGADGDESCEASAAIRADPSNKCYAG